MDNKQKNIIVANGHIGDLEQIRQNISKLGFSEPDLVISADGGADHTLRLGLTPHLVIGDMDSINLQTKISLQKKGVKFIQQPAHKDYTDTYLAVKEAVRAGAGQTIILGATGGRIDHSLANIMLLADPLLQEIDIRIITEKQEIFTVFKKATLEGNRGMEISLFSLTPYTVVNHTKGLKYRLKNERLLFSPVRGVSNEFTGPCAQIEIGEGKLLIVKELQ